MGIGGKMSPVALSRLEKERLCVDLRCKGLPFEEIAALSGYKSTSGAFRAVRRWFERAREKTMESAEELLDIELRALNSLQAAQWPKAMDGDVQACRAIVKISETRRKLLGMDAPTSIWIGGGHLNQDLKKDMRSLLQNPQAMALARQIGELAMPDVIEGEIVE